jgi:hypothetical protein
MSEDRFFQQVKATMAHYSPEVPESVYVGIRKKLWWSNFTRLSVTRFNIWYLAVLITGAAAAISVSQAADSAETENAVQLQTSADASGGVMAVTESAPSEESAASVVQPEEQTSANNTVDPMSSKNHAVAQTDLTAQETESPNQPMQASTSEELSESVNQNPQTVQPSESKTASKKGLKVKTYNSGDK